MGIDEHPLTATTGAGLAATPEQVRRARRYVAARALDANDCRELLEALGLIPTEGSPMGLSRDPQRP